MTTRIERDLARTGALAAALLAAACGGSGASPPDLSGPSGGDAAPSGTLTLLVAAPTASADGYTDLGGKIYDGARPEPLRFRTVASAGGCTLLQRFFPSCTPSCAAGVCVADATCQPYPTAQSAGALTVRGVGLTPFTVTPIQASYSMPGSVALPFPPFAEGAPVTISAAGEALPAFTVTSKGIAPLTLSAGTFAIAKGASPGSFGALTLGWTAPAQPAVATIHVKVDVSHHGGTKGLIECDVPDTGAVTIPADLVTRLVALGVAQYPAVEITRRARGTAAVSGGTVALHVDSSSTALLSIEGVTCAAGTECASGSCDESLGLCR